MLVIALVTYVRMDASKPFHGRLGHNRALGKIVNGRRPTTIRTFDISCNFADVKLPRGLENFDKMVSEVLFVSHTGLYS